jgi:hypothetical protein
VSGSQALYLEAANSCTVPVNGSTRCYALTDRGQLQLSGDRQAPMGSVSRLEVVSACPSATAPGGQPVIVRAAGGAQVASGLLDPSDG